MAEPEKRESKRVRKTAPIQVDADLARKVAVIASHRRKAASEIISPVIRDFVEAQYALVSSEIQKEVKARKPGASG